MLVIVSDLHLTDGTSGETIEAGAFRIFRERLRDLAYAASRRADNRYRPIERLDLVLLGDILDVIRSTRWLKGLARPWSDWKTAAFSKKVGAITEAILERNREFLGHLQSLQDPTVVTVPAATPEGEPLRVGRDGGAPDRVPVKVDVHYMVGNHDWFYHLPGAAYDRIRARIVDTLGLADLPNEPFPYEPEESDPLRTVLEQHEVFARHGDLFDPFNYEGDRNASSLGDVIVVELLNRFPVVVEERLGKVLPGDCLAGLKEVDNVRPLMIVPAWIDGLLHRTCPDPQQARRVKAIWDELADQFLKLSFVRERDQWFRFNDLVDRLGWALKFSRGVSLRDLSRLLTFWHEFSGDPEEPFYRHAFGERTFKNREARYIVYGHTHHHEIVPLDACYVTRGLFEQMYINAGTWRRVHELARRKPPEEEFMGYYVMSYVAFFKDGERCGRTFETWSGALGA